VLYIEVNNVENLPEEFDSFIDFDVLLTVQSKAHQTIHFAFCTDLISKALGG
jgi:hypothetical protein